LPRAQRTFTAPLETKNEKSRGQLLPTVQTQFLCWTIRKRQENLRQIADSKNFRYELELQQDRRSFLKSTLPWAP